MTKVTLHDSYVLVETDDISFTDLREAVELYIELEAKEAELSRMQPEILEPIKVI